MVKKVFCVVKKVFYVVKTETCVVKRDFYVVEKVMCVVKRDFCVVKKDNGDLIDHWLGVGEQTYAGSAYSAHQSGGPIRLKDR